MLEKARFLLCEIGSFIQNENSPTYCVLCPNVSKSVGIFVSDVSKSVRIPMIYVSKSVTLRQYNVSESVGIRHFLVSKRVNYGTENLQTASGVEER